MSWYKTIHITCDGGEHDCMSEPDVHFADGSIKSARADLARHGWVFREGMDLCPICVIRKDTGCTCEINLYWKEDKFLVPYDEPEDKAPDCPAHGKRKVA